MTITAPLTIEASIAARLREKVLEFIEVNSLDDVALAERLNIAPQTAGLLRSRPRWDMYLALSIADQLGIDVTIT